MALDDSLRSLRGLRELAQQDVDRERERRRDVEKYEKLLNEHPKMMEEHWSSILRDRIKELEEENKAMMERVQESLGRHQQVELDEGHQGAFPRTRT